MAKIKVDIGLDIGIASVGWAITNLETLEIMEYGARLFPTIDDPLDSKLKNEERREARSARRQVNRRRTLKRDFIKWLIDANLIEDVGFDKKGEFVHKFLEIYINNPQLQRKWKNESQDVPYILYLRQKALQHKISKNELIAILYWFINHRGFKYEVVEEAKKTKNQKEEGLTKWKSVVSKKFPVENQISYFQDNGYLNGTLNRIFHQKDYLREINQIFKVQSSYISLKNDFLKFFERQRSFEQGPGNEKSKTKYGRFYKLENTYDKKNRTISKLVKIPLDKVSESIWEDTIGRCTFFPTKKRAPKHSFTSEVFNFLNQLNNISVKKTGEVLDSKQKLTLLKLAITDPKITSYKLVKSVCEQFKVDIKDTKEIKGFPIDKNQKPYLQVIESVKALREILNKETDYEKLFVNEYEINENNVVDQILEIFSKTTVVEKRQEFLEKIGIFSSEVVELLARKKLKNVSKTHSLSFYAMRKIIPDLIREAKMNQMIWAHNNNIKFNVDKNYGSTYLDAKWIQDIIVTPTVKRSFRQTTKVLNAIFHLSKVRNYEIRSIIIEMAREAKNKDAKDQETNRQKYFEEKNQQISDLLKNIKSIEKLNISNATKEKIWLLEQQRGHDAYTGEIIDMEDVILRPGLFDIDHIIPYSQSYSNSRSNKVLTRQQYNHEKSNQTAYQYLNKKGNFNKMTKKWKEWYHDKERKVYQDFDKYDYLTTDIDFSIPENQFGFIQRNLVDTRYTTKAILEALNAFAKNEQNPFNFKVKAVNGKMTSFARNKISAKWDNGVKISELKRPTGIPLYEEKNQKTATGTKVVKSKSRIWHGHHAEDAYIVTILNSHYNDSKAIEKVLSDPNKKFSIINKRESVQKASWVEKEFSELFQKFDIARDNLNKKMPEIRFSRMIEKPKNTKLFNETLYKGKMSIDDPEKIEKYESKKILEKNFKASKYFGKSPELKESLMIYKRDPDLYNELNKIFQNYFVGKKEDEEKKNPFYEIAKERNKKYIEVSYKANSKKSKNKAITKKINKLIIVSQKGKKAKDASSIVFAKNNGHSFYESMGWVAINMYKNRKGKYKLIPINSLNHKFKTLENDKVKWVIKKDIIEQQLARNLIEKNSKPVATFFKGDILMDESKNLFFVCGLDKSADGKLADKLEVKFLHRNKKEGEKKQNRKPINSVLTNWKLIKQDILGISKKIKFTF